MKKSVFVSIAMLSFAFFGLQCADDEALKLLDKDGWAVSIDPDLYPYSVTLANIVEDVDIKPIPPIPVDRFDKAELRQLYEMLILAKNSGIKENLLSKNYENMSFNDIKQNENIIKELADAFKNRFFPDKDKDKLDAVDRRGKLTKLFRIATFFEVYPVLAAIVELRTQPEGVFTVDRLMEGGKYGDIPIDLEHLMAKRIEQRFDINLNSFLPVKSSVGKQVYIRANLDAPFSHAKRKIAKRLYPGIDVHNISLLSGNAHLEEQMNKKLKDVRFHNGQMLNQINVIWAIQKQGP